MLRFCPSSQAESKICHPDPAKRERDLQFASTLARRTADPSLRFAQGRDDKALSDVLPGPRDAASPPMPTSKLARDAKSIAR
jgi:hypothetical protein